MKIYALGQRGGETYDAAGKAIADVYAVLKEFGAQVIWNVPKHSHKLIKILDLPYLIFFLLFCVGREDYVFFSIPENGLKIRLIDKIKRIKHYKVVCFINDINAFRYGDFSSEQVQDTMRQEIALIRTADIIVAPNENTVKLFQSYGIKSKMIATGVWDYLLDELHPEDKKAIAEPGKYHIAFAGNLNKSDFLMNLKPVENVTFELWGKLDDERKQRLPQCCEYHGVLTAAEVPDAISWCDLGLVWDGTGADTIEGGLGEYLRYNNSHKCGLYLAAEIPVIVWKESGMAHFVERMECGIAIDSLQQLASQIQNCNLNQLKDHAKKVGDRIRRGDFLRAAFEKAFELEGK